MRVSYKLALTAAALLVLGMVAGWLFRGQLAQPLIRQKPKVIQPAAVTQATERLWAKKIPDLAGNEQALSQWRGKLLVVNLWATWCSPCRTEMPGFSRLQAKYADKNVQFVGITLDDVERVRPFATHTPTNYPLLIGDHGFMPIFAAFGNTTGGLPFTVIIDREGQLVRAHLGLWREAALDAALAELL